MAEPVSRVQIEEAARRAKLPRSAYLVLTALTARLGQNAVVWPSVATLVDDCALSRRSVQLALRRLESAGWLVGTARTGTSTRYQIEIGRVIAGEVRPDRWRPRKPWGVQHVAPVQQVAHAQHVALPGVQHVAQGGCNTLRPNPPVNPPEEPSTYTTHPRTPAQALTASPDAVGRAGVYEAGPVPEQVPERRPLPIQPVPRLPIAPPPAPPSAEAPHPRLVKRPGALGVHPEQREASLAAVHEAPVSRGTRNLTLVDGPPRRPPVYRVGGKELPGALSELLPPALSRLLAPHFRGDDFRSGTQKLFEATDLRFLPGASSEGVRVDLALHFDRVWGIRPKALATVEVPYVAYGVNAREDLERLWTHRKGVCPDKDALIQLVPDDDRRKAMIAELRALGGAQVDGPGWRALSAAMQARQAAK